MVLTKYLPPETSSGDEDNEAVGEAKSGTSDTVNYVEVAPAGSNSTNTSTSEDVKKKPAASVTYAEVKHKEKKPVRPLFGKKKGSCPLLGFFLPMFFSF